MASANNDETSPKLCGDWAIEGTRNVNVTLATDRGWFATYTPLKTTIIRKNDGKLLDVLGHGTVLLPVKFKDARKKISKSSRRILELRHVLHVPSLPCNFIGEAIWDMFPNLPDGAVAMKDIEGHNGPLVDRTKPLICLKLSGPPYGPETCPGSLEQGEKHVVDYDWPVNDREHALCTWRDYAAPNVIAELTWAHEQVRRRPGKPPVNQLTDTPYKQTEEDFVSLHFGDEKSLLRWFDGSMTSPPDRAMGRAIARVLIKGRVDLLVRESDERAWDKMVKEFGEKNQPDPLPGPLLDPEEILLNQLRVKIAMDGHDGHNDDEGDMKTEVADDDVKKDVRDDV